MPVVAVFGSSEAQPGDSDHSRADRYDGCKLHLSVDLDSDLLAVEA